MIGRTNGQMRGGSSTIIKELPFSNYRVYFRGTSGSNNFPRITAEKPISIMLCGIPHAGATHTKTLLTSGNTSVPVAVYGNWLNSNPAPQSPNCLNLILKQGESLSFNDITSSSTSLSIWIAELNEGLELPMYSDFSLAQSVVFPTLFNTINITKPTRIIMSFNLVYAESCAWHVETKEGEIINFKYSSDVGGIRPASWVYYLNPEDKVVCDSVVRGTNSTASSIDIYISTAD